MNLKPFKQKYAEVFPGCEIPSDFFLSWFIGFFEGDGSFGIYGGKNLSVLCTQGVANKEVLDVIQKRLNMGSVIKQGPRVYRWIVRQKVYLELMCLLFNGNLVLPTNKTKFQKFLDVYNTRLCRLRGKSQISPTKPQSEPIIYRPSKVLPSLQDGWLLGFTEAEGCFTVSLLQNSNAFRTRYLVSQKGAENLPVLSHFITLFEVGTIEGHHNKGNYSYVVSGLRSVKHIYKYFDSVEFLGIKGQSYEKFKALNAKIAQREHAALPRVRGRFGGFSACAGKSAGGFTAPRKTAPHLDPVLRKQLVELCNDINSASRKIK